MVTKKPKEQTWEPKNNLQKRLDFFLPKKSQAGGFLLSFNKAEIVESDVQYCSAYGNISSESTYDKKHKIEKVALRGSSSRF